MGEKAPDKVLHQLYVTLGTLKNSGDTFAAEIEKRLRIIVSWLIEHGLCYFLPQFPYTQIHTCISAHTYSQLIHCENPVAAMTMIYFSFISDIYIDH